MYDDENEDVIGGGFGADDDLLGDDDADLDIEDPEKLPLEDEDDDPESKFH